MRETPGVSRLERALSAEPRDCPGARRRPPRAAERRPLARETRGLGDPARLQRDRDGRNRPACPAVLGLPGLRADRRGRRIPRRQRRDRRTLEAGPPPAQRDEPGPHRGPQPRRRVRAGTSSSSRTRMSSSATTRWSGWRPGSRIRRWSAWWASTSRWSPTRTWRRPTRTPGSTIRTPARPTPSTGSSPRLAPSGARRSSGKAGLDRSFRREGGGGDVEFGRRLRASGVRIHLDKSMRVTHLRRFTVGSLLRNDYRRASGWTRLALGSAEASAPPRPAGREREPGLRRQLRPGAARLRGAPPDGRRAGRAGGAGLRLLRSSSSSTAGSSRSPGGFGIRRAAAFALLGFLDRAGLRRRNGGGNGRDRLLSAPGARAHTAAPVVRGRSHSTADSPAAQDLRDSGALLTQDTFNPARPRAVQETRGQWTGWRGSLGPGRHSREHGSVRQCRVASS